MVDKKNNHLHHRRRMRDEFSETGFKGWQKHRVIEYLLFNTIPVADTNNMAHDLIRKCGGFKKVFSATKSELMEVDGIGPKTADFLIELGEFIRYYLAVENDFKVLNSENSEDFFNYLFENESRECFYIICLDTQFHILNKERIFEGGFESVDVDVSRIVRTAVKCDASHIVLAHNHPSGIAKASNADIVSTQAVERALLMVGVKLVDHIIVAGGECFSMSNEKLLLNTSSGRIM